MRPPILVVFPYITLHKLRIKNLFQTRANFQINAIPKFLLYLPPSFSYRNVNEKYQETHPNFKVSSPKALDFQISKGWKFRILES